MAQTLDKKLFQQILLFGNYRWLGIPSNDPTEGDSLNYEGGEIVWGEPNVDLSNYIAKPSGAIEGDILINNGFEWVAGTVTLPYTAAFSAFNDTATFNPDGFDCSFDTEVYKDTDYFTHTTGSAGITIKQAGYYNIQFDLGVSITTGLGVLNFWLLKNGTEIPGTRATLSGASSSRQSASINRLVQFAANDVLKITASVASGSGFTTLADMVRITITTQVSGTVDYPAAASGTPIGLLLALTRTA